jgi:UDP-glucose 4-epimerase
VKVLWDDDLVKVLIAGGAGYIGSTVGSACLDAGITPVILDNLVTGRREFTTGRAFYEGDIADGALVDRIFADHPDIEAVVHCAALIVVPDSVADPIGYYRANVVKSLDFFESLIRNGCERVVFSSSGSIYAVNDDFSVDEDAPLDPLSPYARTKAVCEGMFADLAATQPIRVLSLRYFNPIGSDPQLRTGLQIPKPSHAMGKMIEALETNTPFPVTGTDYPTRDGTGIRDYIHVWDLALAHVRALQRFDDMLAGEVRSTAINLGTGNGTTVRELLDAFNRVIATPVDSVDVPRRPGDNAGVFTRSDRAGTWLGWTAERSIEQGIADTLSWFEIRGDRLG